MNRLWVLIWLGSCQMVDTGANIADVTTFVDPFIGTDGKGKTYPGATVPFGMVQLSPDNGRNGWDWISGYFYPDTVISGFSHLHLTGTGAGDLYDISFFPTCGDLKSSRLDSVNAHPTVYSVFSHKNEQAKPGYYQVYLDTYQVNVELTATARVGFQRYTYEQENEPAIVRLHLGYTRNWDRVIDSKLMLLNDSTVAGFRRSTGWARDQTTYFASFFSRKIQTKELFLNGNLQQGDTLRGTDVLGIFDFGNNREVTITTAISSVSIEQAFKNLHAETANVTFDKARGLAHNYWKAALGKLHIEASEEVKVKFYTALYHSLLAPTLHSDVDGSYRGTGRTIFQSEGFDRYSTFSLWDTYRALHPWLTIAFPEKVPDMMQSLLSFHDESGLLPVWSMQGTETNMMIGYHAVPVLTDAIFKGLLTDTLRAYHAMKKSATQMEFGIGQYQELGYVPYEHGKWSVSKTLEYAYDDWCISQIAKALHLEEDHRYFLNRSQHYLNHFDAEASFFRAKSQDGAFKEPFDPLAYRPHEDYCEANAWQYLWYVPHEVEHLIARLGGENVFEKKLDDMFETHREVEETPEWISGYIGQYVHGNEPSHHVPYLYQYVGAGYKTQQRVRQIMDELYSTDPDGLAGNEDCGQLSAWYLFSALGFYPVNPADGTYVLGSPEVVKASLRLSDNKYLHIEVKNQSEKNIYVKSVQLNGESIEDFYLHHKQIMNGGKLVFEMTDKPTNFNE